MRPASASRASAPRRTTRGICFAALNREPQFPARLTPVLPEQRSRLNASLSFTLPTHMEKGTKSGPLFTISNRFWPKNRCYRKQTSKPLLTGSRFAYKLFAKIASSPDAKSSNVDARGKMVEQTNVGISEEIKAIR